MTVSLPTRRLVSQEAHAMTARPDVPRSKFSGSWTRKTSFDAGLLVPFLCDEILPGDHMRYDVSAYLRIQTLLFPIFDNMKIDTFFFFVPNRLVWSNWVKFMGEQNAPADSIAYTVPQVVSVADGFPDNSIYDHMGVPGVRQAAAGFVASVNALPFRAYSLIYHEWFKDQNIIASSFKPPVGDGPDAASTYAVLRRAKAHDYFTSALPWPQKFTAPSVPIGGQALISGLGVTAVQGSITSPAIIQSAGTGSFGLYGDSGTTTLYWRENGSRPDIYADLTSATGVAINTFRQAFLVQQLLERDARGGTRYTEIIKAHFGVLSPDARLQRPEYIGGGSSPLQITPIAQTATGGGGLGALAGAGTAAGQHRASFAATEHGFILGIINVQSELSYGQGIHRMFTRSTRYDYYWPSLAGLGEQAVLRKELYAFRLAGASGDDTVFGYQERWHEYRQRYSELAGEFRSGTDAAGGLVAWTLAQRFTAAPTLSQTFIEDTPPMASVLAAGASTNQQFLADILIRREAVRPIPMFGTPVTLGRF